MRNYRTNSGVAKLAGTSIPVLIILSSVLLFLVIYSTYVDWENLYVSYGLIAAFSLCVGILLSSAVSLGMKSKNHQDVYHKIFERDSDIIQMVYKWSDESFTYVSPNIQQILGYRSGEVGFSFFKSCFRKEDHQAWLQFFDQGCYVNNRKSLELKMSTKYGVIKWMAWKASLVKSQMGDMEFVLFSLMDITDQKEKEKSNDQYLKELEQIIAKPKKIEAPKKEGQHAINVEDIKEPLRSVTSYVKLIEGRYRNQIDETGIEFLGYVRNGLGKMDGLIDGVSTFSKIEGQTELMNKIDLNKIVDRVRKNLGSKFHESGGYYKSGTVARDYGRCFSDGAVIPKFN